MQVGVAVGRIAASSSLALGAVTAIAVAGSASVVAAGFSCTSPGNA